MSLMWHQSDWSDCEIHFPANFPADWRPLNSNISSLLLLLALQVTRPTDNPFDRLSHSDDDNRQAKTTVAWDPFCPQNFSRIGFPGFTMYALNFFTCCKRPLVDVANHGGFTPLHYASWFDHGDTVTTLMQLGASLKRRTLGWGYYVDPFCV